MAHAALPLPALVISTLLAAVIGITLQLMGRIKGPPRPDGEDGEERPKQGLGRTKIPFGPFLAAGTYLAYLVHETAIEWWLGT